MSHIFMRFHTYMLNIEDTRLQAAFAFNAQLRRLAMVSLYECHAAHASGKDVLQPVLGNFSILTCYLLLGR